MAEHQLDDRHLARGARGALPCRRRRGPRFAAAFAAVAPLSSSATAGFAGTSRAEVEGDRPTAVLGVEAAAPRAGARGTDGAAATTATEARGEPGSGETITLAFAGDTGLAGDAGAAASAAFDALRDRAGLAAEAAAG